VIVWLLYANSLQVPFHFDDWHVIPENPAVRGPADIPSFFTDVSTFSVVPGTRDYRPVFLSAMALAYARLGASTSTAARRIVACMTSHPRIVGGLGRPCTDIMAAGEGEVIAKIGAEGVYGAALTANELGIALKVEDGGMRSAPIALLAIIRSLVAHGLVSSRVEQWLGRVDAHATVTLTNTKNNVTGMLRPAGDLHFPA